MPPPSARGIRALAQGGALASLVLACCGCGGPAFERAPRPAADLSGHWVYLAESSEDAAAIIRAAMPRPRRPARLDRDANGLPTEDGSTGRAGGQSGGRPSGQRRGGPSGDSGAQSTNPNAGAPPVWGRGSPMEFVRAFVYPAQRIDVSSQPELITVLQGERRRSFQPGDEEPLSVNDRYGSRTVRAGWEGAVFNIKSSNSTRLSVLEKFRQLPSDRLGTEVEFSTPGMRTVKVRSVYRRATAAELASAPPDGPPLPGPR